MAARASSKGADPKAEVRRYLAALPPAERRALGALRHAIRSAVPEAVDSFSYGIPGFRIDGRPFIWYAAWKTHTSLYPMSAGVRQKYAREIRNYGTSKGTIRFPIDDQPPPALVKKLATLRRAEMRAKARRP